MEFQKYHGTGNDFILIHEIPNNPNQLAKSICDRHFGIGADGLIYASPSQIADIKFNYYNSDGSIAPMCGNGMRCFVKYLKDNDLIAKNEFMVETLAGLVSVCYNTETKHIKIGLGQPKFDLDTPDVNPPIKSLEEQSIAYEGQIIRFYVVNLGTLHTIVFVNDSIDINQIGPYLSSIPLFPNLSNINFVEIVDQNILKVTTYERGAGWTLSCGTGVSASAVVSYQLKKTKQDVNIIVPGGKLKVYVQKQVFLEGPAVRIATGDYEVSNEKI
ncbi:diaminopimelate epimerase [Peloplasma aerotolerans]|uniref:Diaminopimelate epimerase n=1 Tax=Peloplasma aerotolerans TaxID=3044389 RepID=A0AAW6UAB2_9MOLU|nr:diaminopimelate epimerase [Mariniplasma sp. M4Ah]MDI6452446.1 diaminopimelate epimerase [Mariniplasma sp. M4Ah]